MNSKELIKKLPYPLFLSAYWFAFRRRELRQERIVREEIGIRTVPLDDLARHKNSDTLVVLGSGSSINLITPERWAWLSAQDTVGFNFWLIHKFVPRFYFVEAIPLCDREMFETYEKHSRARISDYRSTVKVITEVRNGFRSKVAIPEQWIRDAFNVDTIPVPARTTEEFAFGIGKLERSGVFDPGGPNLLFKQSSTVTAMLSLAARLRYRKVVLCGVDLRDSRYFYQDLQLYPAISSLQFAPATDTHSLETPLLWRIPVSNAVSIMNERVLKPRGVSLFVENRNSLLYPVIPELELNRETI